MSYLLQYCRSQCSMFSIVVLLCEASIQWKRKNIVITTTIIEFNMYEIRISICFVKSSSYFD